MKEILVKTSNWKLHSPWLAGQLTLWGVVLLGSLMTSLVIHYSSLRISSNIDTVTFAINGGGLLLSGFVAGYKSGQRGWFFGGAQGVLYTVTLLIISFLAFDTAMRINPLLFSTFAFGISAIGGIIGMNTRK